MLEEIIAIIIIVLIIGAALFYIIKAKKSGRKCIGCPSSGTCSHSKEHIIVKVAVAVLIKNNYIKKYF